MSMDRQVLESQNLTDKKLTPELPSPGPIGTMSKKNRWLRAAALTLLHLTESDIQYMMIDKKICALRAVYLP